MTPVIALLTDFGTTDIYVSVMKGVILDICPDTHIIDISHAVQPQNIRQGAFALLNAYRYFPPNTIFVAVVDPGVGSTRKSIAVRTDQYTFVAPDNGLLSYVLAEVSARQSVELTHSVYRLPAVSYTFHGRDIFAPAAAHLARGIPLDAFGAKVEQLIHLPQPELHLDGQIIYGEVMHIDHFGNIITSIGLVDWLSSQHLRLSPRFGVQTNEIEFESVKAIVHLRGQMINGIVPSYSRSHAGDLLAMIGSSGYLEVAVNQGDGAARLGTQIGDRVEIRIN